MAISKVLKRNVLFENVEEIRNIESKPWNQGEPGSCYLMI